MKVFDYIDRVIRCLIYVLTAMLVSLGTAVIILRYVGHVPMGWAETFLALLMVWLVFVSIGLVAREGTHIRFSFFAERIFHRRASAVWDTLENIIGMVLCGYLAWQFYPWVHFTFVLKSVDINYFQYPLWIPETILPIGFALMGLFYVERTIKQILKLMASRASEQKGATGDPVQPF